MNTSKTEQSQAFIQIELTVSSKLSLIRLPPQQHYWQLIEKVILSISIWLLIHKHFLRVQSSDASWSCLENLIWGAGDGGVGCTEVQKEGEAGDASLQICAPGGRREGP